jgi:DnaJ-domain-containing protein 1
MNVVGIVLALPAAALMYYAVVRFVRASRHPRRGHWYETAAGAQVFDAWNPFGPDTWRQRRSRRAQAARDQRPEVDQETYYRRRSATGKASDHWNPYARERSRAYRIRAARQGGAGPVVRATGPHYQLLGVAPDASIEAIEQAYRVKAARIHPDRFFDDPEKRAKAESELKRLNVAVGVLRDPVRRAEYDADLKRG